MFKKSMSGHGTFIYDADATIKKYHSPEAVAFAAKELDMQHVWIRIHGDDYIHQLEPTRTLIKAFKDNGLGVAGWGWCQGSDASKEADLALSALQRFELTDYIADIEDEVSGADWTKSEIKTFFSTLKEGLSSESQIALSTHGFINWHNPSLMTEGDQFVDYFVPQVYWFSFPSKRMLRELGVSEEDFPLNDPASYMRLCILMWRKITNKPLIVTGQAYWGEDNHFTKAMAETKLKAFLDSFDDWKLLQGLNWWHFGGKSKNAMSASMYETIKNAKLNTHFDVGYIHAVSEEDFDPVPDIFDLNLAFPTVEEIRALQAPYPDVDTPLEDAASGVYGYYSPHKRYGLKETIAAIHEVGKIWNQRYPNRRFGIGDISKKGGGVIEGHRSHQKGIDFDVRLLRKDWNESATKYQNTAYSLELTQELIDLFWTNSHLAVEFIFFNDRRTKGTQEYPNHDNHFHVRFYKPEDREVSPPYLSKGNTKKAANNELQRCLNNWQIEVDSNMHLLVVDGDFGDKTFERLVEFQTANNILPADGIVEASIWMALQKWRVSA